MCGGDSLNARGIQRLHRIVKSLYGDEVLERCPREKLHTDLSHCGGSIGGFRICILSVVCAVEVLLQGPRTFGLEGLETRGFRV